MPNLQKLDLKRLKEILTEDHKVTLDPPRLPERFRHIKSFREFWNVLTWRDVEWAAALPGIVFWLLPIIYMSFIHFPLYWMGWRHVGGFAYFVSAVTGILSLLLAIGKCCNDRTILKGFSRQNVVTAVCFLALFILMLVASAANGWGSFVFIGYAEHRESLMTFLSYVMIFFLPAACIRSADIKQFLLYFAMLNSFQLGLLTLLEGLGIREDYAFRMAESAPYTGIFLNTNHYGYYLTATLLLSAGVAAWDKQCVWRVLGALSFVVQTVVLTLNNSLGSFLAVLIGLPFMAIMYRIVYRRHSHRMGLILCAYIALWLLVSIWNQDILNSIKEFGLDLSKLFHQDDDMMSAGSGRIALWYYAMTFIMEKPLLGYGVEGIGPLMGPVVGLARPHNLYMEFAAFFGIPAALCLIVGMFFEFLNGLKRKAILDVYNMTVLGAIFGFAFTAFFGITIFYTTPYFFILLGLGFSIIPSGKTDSQ